MKYTPLPERLAEAVTDTAARIFANDCHINRGTYKVTFLNRGNTVKIEPHEKKDPTKAIQLAARLYYYRGEHIAKKCWEWEIEKAEILSPLPHSIEIFASENGFTNSQENAFTMINPTQPIIAAPNLEIGSLTVSPITLSYMEWMMSNPEEITGITRVLDEAQVVMSFSSSALLRTTTLKKAVQRKRIEFWHHLDLYEFRVATGEYIRELKAERMKPEDTKHERSWRCVSGDGTWRLITHEYTTFLDNNGVPYHFSRNVGVEKIETPEDILVHA